MGYKVMQIEASNNCSLTCVYCPHPNQLRPKGDMSMETFIKCMDLVEHSDNPTHRDGRKFVWLNHFGEPLLNPMLPEFIRYATSRGIKVSFASNGIAEDGRLFPRSVWQNLADLGLQEVELSAHKRSERALREHIGDIVKVRAVWTPQKENFHDWAGQVDMSRFKLDNREIPKTRCDYASNNMFVVTWDGRLAACCYDSEGRVGLSIDDVLRDGFRFREISLCPACRLGRGDANWLADA
ncbi:MAG TPA: radical SAM protein [Stellaceae bacterium]|nr:radical SAM protein [Stellaceae bacterium]